MWPRIGPIPTYGIFYFSGAILHFPIAWWLAQRRGLKRRVWIAVSLCYLLGMTLGAKILFDLRHEEFDFAALLTLQRWTRGGLWGGLLAYFALAVPLVLLLTRKRRAGMDLIAVSLPIPWIMAKIGCLFKRLLLRPALLAALGNHLRARRAGRSGGRPASPNPNLRNHPHADPGRSVRHAAQRPLARHEAALVSCWSTASAALPRTCCAATPPPVSSVL